MVSIKFLALFRLIFLRDHNRDLLQMLCLQKDGAKINIFLKDNKLSVGFLSAVNTPYREQLKFSL